MFYSLNPMGIQSNTGNSKSKLYILACAVFVLMILSGYWLKCQMGIGLFENYSLSKYIPFKYLVPNNIIDDPLPGIILEDSFDSFSLFGNWNKLWMREKGGVIKGHDKNGLDGSSCLLIQSSSNKSWSCSYGKFIRVNEGDVFSFKVSVKLEGDELSAYSGVAAFNKKKQAIAWNFITERNSKVGVWSTLERIFIMPEGVTYIKFRLTGRGIGEFRFDDVYFEKIGSGKQTLE